MSIRVMTWVWDHGPTDLGELVVLLALADFSDDSGTSYPSIKRVAEKARMTDRGCQKAMRRLEDQGYLEVRLNAGPQGRNLYRVLRREGRPETPSDGMSPHETDGGEPRSGVNPRTPPPPERRFTTPPNGGSPHRTVIEPSVEDANASSRAGWSEPPSFQAFWDSYPHRAGKVGRKPAVQAYRRALKRGATEEQIINGAIRYHDADAVKRGFARNPETWLNQDGWTDEIGPTATIIPHPAAQRSKGDARLEAFLRAARNPRGGPPLAGGPDSDPAPVLLPGR